MAPAKNGKTTWEDCTLEPIAIMGMGCHLPGQIRSPSALWELLKAKGSVQTPKVPANRFNIDAYYHNDLERPGSFNVLGGYFLDGNIEDFDPTFFGTTPIEAMWMDPQQRKILEVVYECFESGGLTLDTVSGTNTAVFIGSFTSDYQQMSIRDTDFRHNYAATGVDPGIISNRIGNMFNLRGPSFTLNTACSSSVYAIHNACHALRARDCEAAVVGGVNLIVTVDQHMNTAKLGILSPTSTCHTFDASADGYGRAEGVGALYLKRLSDAIRDGDLVRGVIRSSFVNTNGKVPGMGITHPSVEGQSRALRSAYKRANLDPAKTAYAECHGTGTPVGDPIEVRAVAKAMNDNRSKDKPLLVGAIKANIGHSEAASGIFAVIKAALMTESAIIPGVAGFKKLNPNIKEDEWNVKVKVDTTPWPSDFAVRRASVSSFGYGGTNGHVIVEAVESLYPWYQHGKQKIEALYDHSASRPFLLTFSAHDKATLKRNIDAHAKIADDYYLADLAHTLNTRRSKFQQRAYVVAYEDRAAEAFEPQAIKFGSAMETPPEVGFIFTGQGAQWAGMAVESMRHYPSFLKVIRSLDLVLQRLSPAPSWTLEEVLMAGKEHSRLSEAEISQPACTAIQIAIVSLFEEWEIYPSVTVGHSSGEIGAAFAAGLISAPEAIIAAFYRGLAVKEAAPTGTMLAVGLGVDEVQQYLHDLNDVVVACENSPSSVTLSGTAAGIQAAKERLDVDNVFARELKTGRAYHSHHMNAVAPLYEKLMLRAYNSMDDSSFSWRQPRSRMFSSVTGQEIHDEDIPLGYWSENLRNRVLFNTAVTAIGQTPDLVNASCIIEIGPHSALAGPFKQICIANKFTHFRYIPSFVRGGDSAEQLLRTAGELANSNYGVDLERVNHVEASASSKYQKPLVLVDLPTYQWNYANKFWAENRFSAEQRNLTYPRHDVLGTKFVGLSKRSSVWKNQLRHRDVPWLKDHSLGNSAVFPAAGHLSMAIEALRQTMEIQGKSMESVTLRDVDIKTALVVPDTDNGIEVQLQLQEIVGSQSGQSTSWYSFTVQSITDDVWTTHCEGRIGGNHAPKPDEKIESPVSSQALTQRTPGKSWYDAFRRVGFQYGPAFQALQTIKTNGKDRHAATTLNVDAASGLMKDESRYLLHPSTIDACLQLIIISINSGLHKEMPWGVVPISMEEVTLYPADHDAGSIGNAVAWTDRRDGRYFNTHTKLQAESGRVVLDVKSLKCVAYEAVVPQSAVEPRAPEPYMKVTWEPKQLPDESAPKINGHGSERFSLVSCYPDAPMLPILILALEAAGHSGEIANLKDANLTAVDQILVDDWEGTLLLEATRDIQVFNELKKVLAAGLPIVWVTSAVNQGCGTFGGMNQGFLRAIRSEQAAAKITLLDVDAESDPQAISQSLSDLLESVGTKDSGAETEFWLHNGELLVPRIVPNEVLNESACKKLAVTETKLTSDAKLIGAFEDGELIFEQNTALDLAPTEVEIQVDASINHAQRSQFVVGTVSKTGQKVLAYTDAAYASTVKAPAYAITELTASINSAKLLANVAALSSALNAISLVGSAKEGDLVVLLPTSQAVTNTVVALKALKHFDLVVTSAGNTGAVRDAINNASTNNALTVVVANEFSALAQDVWRLLPGGSRFILNDGALILTPDSAPFMRGASLIATGLQTIYKQKAAATITVSDLLKATVDIAKSHQAVLSASPVVQNIGSLKPSLNNHEGIVIAYDHGTSVIKTRLQEKQLELSAEGAYILVGCLGGLGRSLTTLMRTRGCKNFVFISRSGADKPEAAAVVKNLEVSGAVAHIYRGDASNEADVTRIIEGVKKKYTIRGVVHAAMVLQDGMFEGLTYNQFKGAVDPKVLGALHLHNTLKDTPLDFFVMTSSISAVLGNPGQANYSAANSYLDALARHRNLQGQAATSLALPMVLDVGVVAENENIEVSLNRKGMYGINEHEMLASFVAAMSQPTPQASESTTTDFGSSQIIMGLDPTLLAATVASSDTTDPYWYNDKRLALIRSEVDSILSSSNSNKLSGGFVASLHDIIKEGDDALLKTIADHLIAKCSSILMLSIDGFEYEGRSIASNGLDSMIGAEFRNWLFKEFGLEIGFQDLLVPSMTFIKLAQTVKGHLSL